MYLDMLYTCLEPFISEDSNWREYSFLSECSWDSGRTECDRAKLKLTFAFAVSSFSFFQRKSVEEFMNFTAKIMTERTQVGDRTSVTEGEYFCHVFVRADCLVGVCLSDQEYPPRVAHTLLGKVLDDFTLTVI